LAYLGNVDLMDPEAPRLVWLEDHHRCTIERPPTLWTIPEHRRDDILVQPHDDLRLLVRCMRVSKTHATFFRKGKDWRVRDEESRNGTFVNGEKVTEREHVLTHGDILEMGHTFWRYIEHAPLQPVVFERWEYADFGPTRTISPKMHEGLMFLNLKATGPEHLLILGETGTGKEIAADHVHKLSGRKGKRHPINCATIPPTSPDGYLYGWVRGAFTGATHDQPGHIEEADGGTLVLDEIGTLPLDSQGKLLRLAEEGELYRLGEVRPRRLDVRIVACTNSDIPAMVRKGAFREDLYARLAPQVTTLPPLRDRPEDIVGLVAQFLRATEDGAELRVHPAAMRRLLNHDWPMNVRQLRGVIAEAVPLARKDGVLRDEHLNLPEPRLDEESSAEPKKRPPVKPEFREYCARLEELLAKHKGNVAAVARELGVQRERIYRDCKKRCHIDPRDYR